MSDYDLVIRNGQMVDGTGNPARQCDIGITDGIIAAMDNDLGSGKEEIDAQGKTVTPGFVDVHTHYDGQATWDNAMQPSAHHGVTTAVMGNCGVGFAPCRPEDRDELIRLMEGVEDIPGVALGEGLPWTWTSFPEYLDTVASRPRDIDLAALFPHAPLRVYVMGERATRREPATEEDLEQMRQLLSEGLAAGAVGFATSRTMMHRTSDGEHIPTFEAADSELLSVGHALSDSEGAVFQMVSDFADEKAETEFNILRQQSQQNGCRSTFTLLQNPRHPNQYREHLDRLHQARDSGLDIRGQILARPLGVLMGFQSSLNIFCARPTYRRIAHLPHDQLIAELAKPEIKDKILREDNEDPHQFVAFLANKLSSFYPLGEKVDYFPAAGDSVTARAEREGRDPEEWLYDYFLQNQGRALVYVPVTNYVNNDPTATGEMLKDELTIPALGDGGAHVGTICDASVPTFLLTEWVRDRGELSLEQGIHLLTQRPAEFFSLNDRGVLAVGRKADINVIDMQALELEPPFIQHDLPAGGPRFLQAARGYHATVVDGEITYRDGQPTGSLPGKLVRGIQHAAA